MATIGAAQVVGLWRPGAASAQDAQPFGRPQVIERARELAARPFEEPTPVVPAPLTELSFSDYQRIAARRDSWLFVDSANDFAVEPLHSGFIYREPVELFVIEGGRAVKLEFETVNFDYPQIESLPLSEPLEFAGFRARAPINEPDRLDPFLVFAGGSYFSAVARGQAFGLSARGLAIRTGEADGEEFPLFRAFWIEEPADGRMVVHALLDTASATGAYRFTIRPGEQTLIDVEAILFARAQIDRLGLAPLTSMFLFDARGRANHDNPRQAVHNSDGLALWNGRNERIWRPLNNPRLLQISAFADSGPRGFGLIQREKRFSEYEDLSANFERRPSLWVEPIGDWGPGNVVLVEIPSSREIHDNIVAFWRPEAPLAEGSETTFTYRLTWGWDAPSPEGLLRVTRTLTGAGAQAGRRAFVVDYSDPGGQISNAVEGLEAKVLTTAGGIENVRIAPNPAMGAVRVSFELTTDGIEAADMRLELTRDARLAGEVWVYQWTA
jgi:periplasmic glucans biosynthesis protein